MSTRRTRVPRARLGQERPKSNMTRLDRGPSAFREAAAYARPSHLPPKQGSMPKDQVYVFIVRPPIISAPPQEKVVLATGPNMDAAFENVRESLSDRDFSARCVGAYTRSQLTKLLTDKTSLPHQQAWAALDYVGEEYDLSVKDMTALRRIQDKVLATMLHLSPAGDGQGITITAK